MRFIYLIAACLLSSVPTLFGQDEPYYVTRLSAPINFDGIVDEAVWKDIEPFKLTMSIPTPGAEPTEMSDIRIAYDDDYVYLSGYFEESEPDKIMANTKKRDGLTAATQYFGMVIDSYNDNENGLAFFTTPTGIRFDMAVFGDVVPRNPTNLSWNTFWDVKIDQHEKGWQSEMRIPFSSLAFESREEVTMGITTWRVIARKNEVDIYPMIRLDYGDWSFFKPSLAKDMIFKNIQSKKPFYITPYVLGGYSHVNALNDPETAYEADKKFIKEIGGDIKYGLSKNWTLDLSFNTDFAQVEADDQQVNLTRFSLFFPEKRLFFQERAGIFNFSFGGGTSLFYSRRIGLNADNQPIRIYGGARVVGRSGKWDVGMLSMQTGDDENFDGENMTVIRAKREIINANSDAGMMITNRMNFDGSYTTNYGLDLSLNTFKDNFMEVKWASTLSDKINGSNPFSIDPARIWVAFFTRRQKGFGYGTSYSRAGRNYDPTLGFEQRENYTRFGNRVEYGWFPSSNSFIFRHALFSRGSAHWDNATGLTQSLDWRMGWQMSAKKGWFIEAGIRPGFERLIEEFDVTDDVIVPIGEYNFLSYYVEGGTTPSRQISLLYEMRHGNFYDGTISSINLNPQMNLSSSLEMGISYQFNLLDFDNRGQRDDIHLGRIKALYMFDTKLSIAALLQYNNQNKNFSGNIRLRYNPAEGNDLYIVYNDDINTDLYRETPYLPRFNQRNIVIKYSYTFQL